MIKKFYLSILTLTALLFFGAGNAWGEETLHLGSNNSSLIGAPVSVKFADKYYCSQTVYPAASLAAMKGKSITHLTYFLRALNPNGDYASVQIRLLEVEYDVLATSSSSTSFKSIDGSTLVYEGSMPASTTTEMELELNAPFAYSGGNLLIDVRKTVTGGSCAPSSSTGGMGRFKGTSVSTYVGLYNYGSYSFPTTATPLTYYPDITFTYGVPSSCIKPSALTQGAVTHNSAAFTWTAGGSETTWQYVYLSAATTLTDEVWSGATAGTVTSPAVTLSGLSAATEYKLYVRADCGSEQSKNINAAFRTNNVIPFSEDFTGLTSGIPAAWDNTEGTTSTASYRWNYNNSGHDAAPCVRFNSYSNGNNKTNILKTPAIYVDKAAALSFWYKNPVGGDFSVYYSIDGVKQADALATGLTGAANWTNYEVTLPAECVGHNVQILFQGTSNYGSGDAYIYLDEVLVEAASTCVKPTALNAYATAYNKASVSWTAGGEETAWNLQYSADNFDTYTSVNGITANPYVLTGLTANTTYKVRIQADCGSAQSGWVVSSAFTTPCEPVNGMGWSEDFEDATAGSGKMPDCWQKNTANNSYPQVSSTSSFQKTGSTKCLYFDGGASGSARIAILPPFTEETNTFYVTLDYSQGYYDSYWEQTIDYSSEDYGQLAIGYMTNPADASTFTAKETLPRVNAYTTASVALTGAPANSYVALRYAGGDYSGYLFVDNISISTIPSCLAPSAVAGSATTFNQASIAWTVNGTENAWKLQYKATDAENWSAEIPANTNPFNLTGLSANTSYIVQVKALCGGEDVSSWSGPSAPFSTPCAPVDASDYSETMENATAGVGHLPDCWQYKEKYSAGYPYVYEYDYYAYAGSKCLYFQGGVDESSEQSVLLPEMDQPLNGLTFEFYYKDAESGWYTYAKFTVGYIAADGTTFVPIDTLNYADSYTKYTKDLSALPADAKCLAIRFAGGESSAYGYIDNVRVYPTPTCAAPTGVTVSNVTATTADVAWTENNGATAWNLQISNDGTNWTNVNGVITNPYQLTGLTPNHTTYYVRVNSVCGGTDPSPYSEASAPFYTECGSVALPFSENFSAAIPCWTKVSCESSTGLNNGTFRFAYNTNPPQYLISPEINTDDKPVTVGFDYWAYSSSYPETFKVGYSTTTNEVSAFTWGATTTATNTDSPLTYSENLPAGVKYVAIQYLSYDKYYLYIDNFSVTEYVAPACPAVTASTIEANAQAHTATITWDAAGEETAWNLQYKAAGAAEWSTVIPVATTPSHEFENLAENTLYYVRVQADCDGDGTSEWTGDEAFSFPTDCDPKAVTKAQPWSYSFEDTEDGFMPACWDREEPYANYGYPVVAEYSYYANTGSKYLYFRTPGRSSVYEAYTEDAILPVFNTEIKNLKVSFVYFNNANTANYGQLAIGYIANNTFTQVGELLAMVDDYTSVEREMPDDAPDGARIAIRCIGGNKGSSYTTYIYLDDIVVSLKPTCYVPTALAAQETSDGAVLTWTAGKDENEWSVRYSVKDANEWTVVDDEITANNYTLTGLNSGTTYEAQVKAVCGVGDESEWSASVEFTPACNAPSALAVTARTANSATFSWTSSESAWVLQYSTDGENWESENVNANPYTLTNLAAGTAYQAKIQAACGSEFSNEVEFTTWCALANANELPLNEDFSAGAKPDCWQFISATEYPTVANNKIWFQGENEQIVMLPGYNINLNQLHVSFDFTANNASIELGYYAANGGAFQSLGAVTSGADVDLSTKSAPAEAGYLAIRYYDATASYSTGSVDNVHVSRQIVLADGDDNSETLGAYMNKTIDVTIGRTLFCDGDFNTLCLPFDLPSLDGTPLAGGELWAFKYGYVENGELLVRIIEADAVQAGVPYLITFDENMDDIVSPLFKNVTIAASAGVAVGQTEDVQFVGIMAPELFTKDDYTKLFVAVSGDLAWSGYDNHSLKAFRAFFQTIEAVGSNSGSAPIRHGMPARIVKQENSATGVENVQFDAQTLKRIENGNVVIIRNGVKYNIQGQVISK